MLFPAAVAHQVGYDGAWTFRLSGYRGRDFLILSICAAASPYRSRSVYKMELCGTPTMHSQQS